MIGEGAFGKVYKYFNKENGNIYAVKELNFANIVKYYGSFSNAKKLNIVLEYCRGGSLLALLKIFNSFDENIIRKYITQILDGLEYLHCHNIIHRDIKCANILIVAN